MTHVSLIIKATRLCNLRCSYCRDWRAGPGQTMSFSVMSRLIAAALDDPEHERVDFVWHGGESTLLPMRFYEKAMYVQSRFRRPAQRVTNAIQTNGTRLTPEWARFFRRHRIGVGVSLDGPPEVHDRYRRYASGRPSFADVSRGMRLLKEEGVPFDVLMVIDEGALELGPDRVFDFFLEHGIRKFGLNFVVPPNQPVAPPATPAEHYVDPERMTDFLVRLYDRWREHGDRGIWIRELDVLCQRIAGRDPGLCRIAGGCIGAFYLIEPDGEVAHCDLFVGDPHYTLGHLLRDDFAAIRRSASFAAIQAENEQQLAAMRACPEFPVCNGWCPHERYTSGRHNPGHRSDCCGLRRLIEHLRARIAGGAPVPALATAAS